jgi:predicted ATP-grasp superfamily ATP-dependent carboligase
MAHLLIIELPGGNDGDILSAAIRRGDDVTFLASRMDHYTNQPTLCDLFKKVKYLIEVDLDDWDQLDATVNEIHLKNPVHAVLCLLDLRLIAAAHIAETLKLPFIQKETACLLRDKYSVRQKLSERGLLQPEFSLATNNSELKDSVARLGLPLLIKPSDGFGSQNIAVIRDESDLLPWINPLDDMLPSHYDYGLGIKANDRLLVERYMDGQLVGCDMLSANGQHVLLGVNEKIMFPPPSFAIKGGCFKPYDQSMGDLYDYASRCLDAVGFQFGASHIEIMLTKAGPQLVEINGRLVGARIARLMSYALGYSVHEALIDLHVTGTLPAQPATSPYIAVSRWLVSQEEGILDHIQRPDSCHDAIREVAMFKKPGDLIGPAYENAQRLGYVMVASSNQEEADAIAEAYIEACTIKFSALE